MDGDELTHTTKYVESEITRRLTAIEEHLDCDVITCFLPISPPFDDLIRDALEDIDGRRGKLLVILETYGGHIETAERVANVLRHHYPEEVNFVVPNHAMSAGTILVMSGDNIYMDYYSILGPIDPQLKHKNGNMVPALGYLDKYGEMIERSRRKELSAAEIAILVQKFDPAEIHRYEQARDHSIDLLKKWLAVYKFKNWKTTSSGKTVTKRMREARAAQIAKALNDTKRWRSHARGLSMDVVRTDLNLVIANLADDPELNKRVRSYYRLLQDHMSGKGHTMALHTRNGLLVT